MDIWFGDAKLHVDDEAFDRFRTHALEALAVGGDWVQVDEHWLLITAGTQIRARKTPSASVYAM